MRCIQLGSSVGCSRVPQVHFVRKHFVRKQTMCKSLYTYLTICFAFEKPRWLLHNTADRAETVFSHLKTIRNAKRHRKSIQQSILNTVIAGRRLLLQVPLIILLVVSFNESQEQDSAGVFKATLVGGKQVGTPTVENDFKKHYVFQGEPFSSF